MVASYLVSHISLCLVMFLLFLFSMEQMLCFWKLEQRSNPDITNTTIYQDCDVMCDYL